MRDLPLERGNSELQFPRMPWENEPGIDIPCLPDDLGDVPAEEDPEDNAMPIAQGKTQ
jgi:hypothetical protein